MPSWGGAAKGAATGAAIGSVVPGVGTLAAGGVGALLGGLFGGGKDDPSKKPGAEDPASTASAALAKSSTSHRKRADALGGEGDAAMQLATQYFEKMLGGDPTATNPQVGMVIDQYDTARKNIAEFGGRGGGTTSASAQSRVDQAGKIADVRAGGMTAGAQALAEIGQSQQGLALNADQLASMDLNSVMQHALGEKQLDVQEQGNRSQMTSQLAQGLGYLLGQYLTRKKAA